MTTRITPLPIPVPSRQDPINFAARADAFLGALPTFADQANALADELNGLSQDIVDTRDEAVNTVNSTKNSAVTEITNLKNDAISTVAGLIGEAEDFKDASRDYSIYALEYSQDSKLYSEYSAATANFKGLWSSLTGRLDKPASVKHNNLMWLLLNDLTDVTTSEPSESNPDWTVALNTLPTQDISSSLELQPNVNYNVTESGITLSIPSVVVLGSTFTVNNTSEGDVFIDWNGFTVKGLLPDSPMKMQKLKTFSVIKAQNTFIEN